MKFENYCIEPILTEDFYSENMIEEYLADDIINAAEQGFMAGYLAS